MSDTLSLVKGTLDVLVLKALSWGPMHGFEITRWLEGRSAGALEVRDSALYQALYRLEERGLVKEIRLHLELRVEQLTAEGIGPREARAERCVVLASWTKLVGRCSARRTAGRSGCACAPGWTCCGRTSATARGSSRGTRPLPKIGNYELLIANFEF